LKYHEGKKGQGSWKNRQDQSKTIHLENTMKSFLGPKMPTIGQARTTGEYHEGDPGEQ
jgi:hypothetical protein